MKLYFLVSLAYSIVNSGLAGIILFKSRRNLLSKFYAFSVFCLVVLGTLWYFLTNPVDMLPVAPLEQGSAFIYALFPFFFLHFMLIFLRRYEVVNSTKIIFATYFVGLFCYTLVLLDLIPLPFSKDLGVNSTGFVYFITWMSMLFAIGVALLYSLIGGFAERGMGSNLLFFAVALLMLMLPTPFTVSLFSVVMHNSFLPYFVSSTLSLAIIVFLVFRHRMTMNTPYQAMKSALAAMNDVIIKTNADYQIDMVQGAIVPLIGYEVNDILGKDLRTFLRDTTYLDQYREQVLSEKVKEFFFDTDVLCKNGSMIPMEFSFTPVFGNEEIVGFVGVGRNISERRNAEQALQESEARYRLLFESNPSPMLVYDLDSLRFLLVNTAAIRHYGFSVDEFMTMTVSELLVAPGTNDSVEEQHRRKDGTLFAVEASAHAIVFGDRPARLVMVTDITKRKLAEEAILKSEEQYRRYFEEDLTGYMCASPDGKIKTCNPAFVHIFGFASTDEALRTNLRLLYQNAMSFEALLRQLQKSRELVNHEEQLRRIDGQPVYVIENMIGTFNEAGELTEIRTYIFDNTGRKKLEDELRHAQKMENLGSLAGGIAHDFNNILAIISVHASILKKHIPKNEKIAQNVEALSDAGGRAAALVRQLLTFARRTEAVFEPVNINVVVEELVKMVTPTFPKTIDIELRLSKEIPTISADTNQLHQLLLNLCVNARDAMLPSGTLLISTESLNGSVVRRRFPVAREDQYACISVTDTGTGMDEVTRARIFEPFFTTKGVGKGTGLGLSVVYGIVKTHHGFIDLETEVGHGTSFKMYFASPRRQIRDAIETVKVEDDISGGTETILLVEDEDRLLIPLKGLLEEQGYQVIVARDGVQAVEVYTQNMDKIALVLSDIGLPKQDGWAAFLQMRESNPKVRAILASGNFDLSKKPEMIERGIIQFIQKPYILDQILRTVRAALDSTPMESLQPHSGGAQGK